MHKNIMFVGLDVHKETIDIALAEAGRTGKVRAYGTIGGDLNSLEKVLNKLVSQGNELRLVYEAGPCGYDLYRYCQKKGIDCTVVSPSRIPQKSGDRIKTDRRDALTLARLHRAGELEAITVPNEEDEAIRDLTRAREDAVNAYRKSRQHLLAFLLRQGIRYAGKTNWTPAHKRWLSELILKHPSQQIVFQEYLHAIEETHQRVERLTEQIGLAVESWGRGPVVKSLMALRGVSLIVAAALVSELGDVTRFDNPRQLMGFLGLVPSQYSSGPRRRLGSITKTGNGHARWMLIEAAHAYLHPAKVARHLQIRQEGLPQNVRQIAWNAQVRLCRRYRHFINRGKPKNVAFTAIARELVGFVWAIGQEMSPA